MATMYQLSLEMEDLLQREDADEAALEKAFGNIQEKATNICQFLANLSGDIDAHKAEEARIAARRKAMENLRERTKDYLRDNMELLMLDKIKAGTFTIALQDSPPSVVVDEESVIPARFHTIIPESIKIDKTAIALAIKGGELVVGAHLEHKKHIRIR